MEANILKGHKMLEFFTLLGSTCSIACFIVWAVEKISKAMNKHKHQKSNRPDQR